MIVVIPTWDRSHELSFAKEPDLCAYLIMSPVEMRTKEKYGVVRSRKSWDANLVSDLRTIFSVKDALLHLPEFNRELT